MNWFVNDRDSVIKELKTDTQKGLSSTEVQKRLDIYGENKLKEKTKKPFHEKLIEQLLDPMVVILLIAAGISAISGDVVEMIIILAIVVLNATMSLIQEGKAENSVEALQKMSAPDAKVLRDGIWKTVKSTELVPGDIVKLETGDIVPADMRLLTSVNLKIDESSLTGESVPVDKDAEVKFDQTIEIGDRTNYAHSSCIVTYGRCEGVITDTGHNTEIGKIATNIASFENEETPLQKKLTKLSKTIGILVIGISVVVFLIGILRPDMGIVESLKTAVSLSVAAIPEGMAAVVTIVLSIGMNRMASRNAIVKKLLAVETLGTTTVICSDKTGTLTQNEMTVKKVFVNNQTFDVEGVGYEPTGNFLINNEIINAKTFNELVLLMSAATLNNDAKLVKEENKFSIVGDPTEGALITFAEKAGLINSELNSQFPRVKELPFDSDRKMMTTFHKNYFENKFVSFTKGAPDIIIDRCKYILQDGKIVDFTDDLKNKMLAKNSEFSRQALRVLAYAYKLHDELIENATFDEIESNLILIGLSGMIDPARPEAREAIKECKSAGITPIMITGDYLETAIAIGKDLGIADNDSQAMMGKELNELSPEQIREVVKTVRIFARVSPENKVQIVTALKQNGEITAMTGDGVNDAPAIKKADIGIAMGITGTDVAKNTAEVILVDDNFATIVNAVEEGRIIYSNIKKFVGFLLSCNIGEVIVMLTAMIVGAPVPLTVIQLLWLNLVTDSFPALALGVEKGEPDIMNEKPRKEDDGILDSEMKYNIIVQSVSIGIATLAAFFIGLKFFGYNSAITAETKEFALNGARTMSFLTLIVAELLRSFSARSAKLTLKELGIFTNPTLVKAFVFSLTLTLFVVYIPFLEPIFGTVVLGLKEILVVLLLSFIPFISGEVHKMRIRDK